MFFHFIKKVLRKSKSKVKGGKNQHLYSHEQREYKRHRNQAVRILNERTEEIARKYGFLYKRVTVKNTKTRWGSCSSKKNINLHYKLIFLPDELRDYVIIHELCHLREMNHSAQFWKEVESIIPDYKRFVRKMRLMQPKKVRPTS